MTAKQWSTDIRNLPSTERGWLGMSLSISSTTSFNPSASAPLKNSPPPPVIATGLYWSSKYLQRILAASPQPPFSPPLPALCSPASTIGPLTEITKSSILSGKFHLLWRISLSGRGGGWSIPSTHPKLGNSEIVVVPGTDMLTTMRSLELSIIPACL